MLWLFFALKILIYNDFMNLDCREELVLKQYMPNASVIKNITEFFYAFSDATRLKIIMLLTIKSFCVGEISTVLSINQTTVSHQLKILKALNIVECDRNGKNIIYYIKNSNIQNVLNATVECV